ncbi:MAG: hypothetical protein IJJ34_04810 [Clostridia bacterium]|nr:hypothetical protein [Clostridia bacterium]
MKMNDENASDLVERLLEESYVVIDMLPMQVPRNSAGQYFTVERYYLEGPRNEKLRAGFVDILLKLNCYYDLFFLKDGEEKAFCVDPDEIAELVICNTGQLCVIAKPGDALITYAHDDAYMTVYHADETMVKLVKDLASANGLFVWKPETEVL